VRPTQWDAPHCFHLMGSGEPAAPAHDHVLVGSLAGVACAGVVTGSGAGDGGQEARGVGEQTRAAG
jgi:hypothetical protein